jgi:HSP20 family molecular chaperone IbpA
MSEQEISPHAKKELQEKEQTRPGRFYVPDVDIFEEANGLWLWADMPGVDQQRLDVALEDDILTIRGEVALDDYEGLNPLYTEYNVGHFLRRFTVPSGRTIDRDKIRARIANGVLELFLPKAEAQKPHRIQISSGD